MEVLESGEQSVLQWDRKLSELSEPGESEALMYPTVRTRRGRGKARAVDTPLGGLGEWTRCHHRNVWGVGDPEGAPGTG